MIFKNHKQNNIMSSLISYFYDQIMANAEKACLQQWRSELLQQVSGDILEIESITRESMRKTISIVRPTIRGSAIKL